MFPMEDFNCRVEDEVQRMMREQLETTNHFITACSEGRQFNVLGTS